MSIRIFVSGFVVLFIGVHWGLCQSSAGVSRRLVDLSNRLSEVTAMAVSWETGTIAVGGWPSADKAHCLITTVGRDGRIGVLPLRLDTDLSIKLEFAESGAILAIVHYPPRASRDKQGVWGDQLTAWDLRQGLELLKTPTTIYGVSSASSVFATVTQKDILRILDMRTGAETKYPLQVDNDDVQAYLMAVPRSLALSPDGTLVALGSGSAVRIIERQQPDLQVNLLHRPPDEDELVKRFKPWFDDPNAMGPALVQWYEMVRILRFSPDGSRLLSVRPREARPMGYWGTTPTPPEGQGEGSDVVVWKSKGWMPVKRLSLTELLSDARFSPDSKTLGCVGFRGRGFVIDIETGREVAAFTGMARAVGFLDARRAVCLRNDATIEVVDF